MSNFNALREKVYTVVRDTNRTFITEADVDMWMQEAMQDLSSRLRLAQASVTSTVSGGVISLPADYVDLISLSVGTEDSPYVEFDVDDETYNLYVSEEDDPGITLGRVFNRQVELYPAPTNGTTYTLRYWNSESDSLSDFTGSLEIRIVNYARAHALYKNREPAQGDRYMEFYERGLPSPDNAGKNHNVGPMTIKPEPNYFETSAYLGY